jgi:rhodanese-related sulfurtransferase
VISAGYKINAESRVATHLFGSCLALTLVPMMIRTLFTALLGVALTVGCALGNSPPHSRIDGKQAHELVQAGARLLDVRTPQEFSQKHVDAAINIPVQELDNRLRELEPKDRPIVVYCRSGHRSALAYDKLKQAGYAQIYDLGPMTAW